MHAVIGQVRTVDIDINRHVMLAVVRPPVSRPVEGSPVGAPSVDGTPVDAGAPDGRATRPTLRDVAHVAKVSPKTVSRVINLEPGVNAATAERIHAAIAELGFRRNDMARLLRKGETARTLGLVIEDLGNPFFSVIAGAVERVARTRGYVVMASSSEEDPDRERELLRSLLERRVDGLLIVPAGDDHRFLLPELAQGTPVVFIDRPPGQIEADTIVIDNRAGARTGTEHLLARGHRSVAMIGELPRIATTPERLQGYRDALEARGVPYDPRLVRVGQHDAEAAEAATRDLLEEPDPPTAVFAGNNRVGVGALRAIRACGRPVALVCFDDIELGDLLGLTVVAHETGELGRQAAELLYDRLDGDAGPPRRIVVPTRLIARGSGEVPPAP
jgi:LacI family transcriptional regulator